jgi:hypothetical protein
VLVAGVRNQIAPPQVAAFLPVDFAAGTFEDHHVLNAFHVRVFQRVVDVFLQRDGATGAQPFIGGDHQARAGVDNTSGNRFGEKPPKMTEWIAPMRAQASMATAASGTIGI